MSGKKPVCVYCRRNPGKPVTLPITGERTSLCDLCRGPAFMAHMRRLVVWHG